MAPLSRLLSPTSLALCALALPASAKDLAFGAPQFLPGDTAVGPAVGTQETPEIAAGPSSFLTVWSDLRSSPDNLQATEGSGYDIYAALLDAAGNPMLTPIVINDDFGDQLMPHVAWNGQHWLVVWKEETPTLPTYEQLRGVRVASDGTILDATPLVIHDDQAYYGTFEGFVVEGGGPDGWAVLFHQNGQTLNGLFLVRVASDGTVVNPSGLQVKNTGFSLNFDLAFAQDEYMVVWQGSFDGPRARRYSPTLQPLGTTVVPFADKVASNGTDFLVIADRGSPPFATVDAFLLSHDGVASSAFTLAMGGNQSSPCCGDADWDGTNFWATWGNNTFARVTPTGQVLDPGGITIPPPTPKFTRPAFVGAPGGGIQWSWNDGTGGLGYPKDVHTARITPAMQLTNPAVASVGVPAQVESDLAQGAGTNLIVFRSRTSGFARILAQRIDDSGVALDPEPIEVASGPVTWLNPPAIGRPSVAWNGTVFMITWADAFDVFARRLNPDGSFVDATPLTIMSGMDPSVGALGSNFLVVGSTTGQFLTPSTLRFVRVDGVTGANLDPQPVQLSPISLTARHAHVETLGGRWLVVWQSAATSVFGDPTLASGTVAFVSANGATTGSLGPVVGWRPNVAVAGDRALLVGVDGTLASATTDLEGRILMADGTFLGPPFPISDAFDKQLRPAATWNGSEFVVAWEDKRNAAIHFDERTDIYGARVSVNGIVLDPLGLPFAAQPEVEIHPAFLTVGGNTLLAVSTLRPENPSQCAFRIGLQSAGGGPAIYCTAKTSSAGCSAQIGTTTASQPVSGAGGYSVTATSVQSFKNGLLFGGVSGAAALPFSGGTLCMNPPTKRGPVTGSGGSGFNTCTGSYSTEVNDGNVIPLGLDAGLGNSGWYQYWYRDPANGAGQLGTALSNAVQLDFQ